MYSLNSLTGYRLLSVIKTPKSSLVAFDFVQKPYHSNTQYYDWNKGQGTFLARIIPIETGLKTILFSPRGSVEENCNHGE